MKIAVAGAGYVGLSIATLLAQNNEVVIVDVVKENIYQKEGKLYGMKVFPNKKESPE